MTIRLTQITVTNEKTADIYLALSYPSRDFDGDGRAEVYKTPVYKVYIDGTDAQGASVRKGWTAIRFAPYYNDPKRPNPHYRHRGWTDAGLHQLARKAVTHYNPAYNTSNTPSPHTGAIQLRGNFLIHAGPEFLGSSGWGSAGCVEIIGNFSRFKTHIAELSGTSATENVDARILAQVEARKLFVQVDFAVPPDFHKLVDTEIELLQS